MNSHHVTNLRSLFLLALALNGHAWADPLDEWTWRNPLPQGNSLSGVSFGANRFVAVGQGGAILSSSDGDQWSEENSGLNSALAEVLFANDRFVAVGAQGTILGSADGRVWTAAPSGLTNSLAAVAYGNGTYVAVGSQGTVLTSTDGLAWTNRASPSTALNLVSVAYGAGLFVAIASYGEIIHSADGVSWETQPTFGGYPTHIIFANNEFLIVDDEMHYSLDGTNWHTIYNGPAPLSVTYGNGHYVGVDYSGFISSSVDATNWVGVTRVGSSDDLYAVAFGKGTFVAVGRLGLIRSTLDGVAWSVRSQSLTHQGTLYGVRYVANQFAAVGAGEPGPDGAGEYSPILFSGPSTNWLRCHYSQFDALYDIVRACDLYVVAGYYGLHVSTNASDWVDVNSGLSTPLNALTYLNNLFITMNRSGGISTSTDGLTWFPRSSGTAAFLWDAAYGNGLFVVVGQGVILTSTNGTNWTKHASPDLRRIAFGSGAFVVVGENGYIATSLKATDWTVRSSGTTNTLYGLDYGEGRFVAVGDKGTILTSADGVAWNGRNSGTIGTLMEVAYGNGTFVAVGSGGAILQSGSTFPSLISQRLPGAFEVNLLGGLDRSYAVQSTTNLASGLWRTLATLPSVQRQFTDTDNAPAEKFYRLTLP